MIDINYIKITQFDTANGPGIRTTLWVAGCSHRCRGCHNESTWEPNQGKEFTQETIDFILDTLDSKYIAGLTLSGGDPLYLYNRSDISNLVTQVKAKYPDKPIWLYTGYTYDELLDLIKLGYDPHLFNILSHIDVLVDGPFISWKKDMSLPYCGSTNQRVIDMKRTLAAEGDISLSLNRSITQNMIYSKNVYLYGDE